jgi:ribosomal protein S18 acetylase RimI-like enzyme
VGRSGLAAAFLKLVISSASGADAEAILALQRIAYESEAKLYCDWSIPPLTQTTGSLREELVSSLVLKATADGLLVGSVRAGVTAGRCAIGRLIVHPDYQNQGIGSALLRAVEGSFPNVAEYELFTGSRSEGNIRLYQRHGYSITRTEQLSEAVTLVYLEKPGARSGRPRATPDANSARPGQGVDGVTRNEGPGGSRE